MSIALYCNPSPGLAKLYQTRQISLDGVEYTPFYTPLQIRQMNLVYADLVFQFHASNLGRAPFSRWRLTQYNQACPGSQWVSIHLSLVPAWVVFPALKFGVRLPLPDHDRMEKRIIRRIKRLKAKLTLPVILENMPVNGVLHNLMESEPDIIRRVLNETGVDMLLDLAHARVAADFRQMSVEDYLVQLPLDKVRQIHLSGIRVLDGTAYDAHEILVEDDYRLLSWVLDRTHPEAVTLEYYKTNQEALREMLVRIKQLLDAVSNKE